LDATAAVPVNWMVMDDCRPDRRVRYFVIEGSNSLASWQVHTPSRTPLSRRGSPGLGLELGLGLGLGLTTSE